MWVLEPFREDHDCESFDCGDESLNSWLKDRAVAWTKQGLARVLVAVDRQSGVVAGYYTLSSHYVCYEELPGKDRRGLPRSIDGPAVLIGRLAVDKNAQGKALGTGLLFNAFSRVVDIADRGNLGIRVVEVQAYPGAREFYLKCGLHPLEDDPDHLFVSLKEIRKLQQAGDLPRL